MVTVKSNVEVRKESGKEEPLPSSTMDSILETILVDHRWIFVCIFLLPLSLLYDIWDNVRSWLVFKLNSAPEKHSEKVGVVQAQVRKWIKLGKRVPMCTARPGWQTISFRRPKYKDTLFNVKVNLVDILELDIERKTVRVEPMVTMGQLTARLEPFGWTLPVLPELDDLTVGGLVNGTGIETSSHKFGLFQHICTAFELVLPSGEVVNCSKDVNTELFYSIPWSYGTLGFLTSVDLQIVPAKRFVKLDYYPAQSMDKLVEQFHEQSVKVEGNQFVEGIMFSKTQGVVMVANMVTSAEPSKTNRIGRWYKPWFFKHVESFLLTNSPSSEYIPLRDYLHRHSRSIFWEIREIIPFGNHPIFRYLLGWMSPPKISLLKLTQTKSIKKLYESHHMIQDMLVPLPNLKDALLLFDEETKIYPIWLCPFKLPNDPGMLHPKDSDLEMYVDIGVYGIPNCPTFHAEKTTREIEKFVRKVHGFQMLYADTYMTREEFRQMFDHKLYDQTRKKYNCIDAFPEVYDKVSKEARI